MKFVFITLFFISNIILAQSTDEVTLTPPTKELNESVTGAIAEPTSKQKKHIKDAAKMAKKKKTMKSSKKNGKVKSTKKSKKAKKTTY